MFSLKRGKIVCCRHCNRTVSRAARCEACGMKLQRWTRGSVLRFSVFISAMSSLFLFQVIHAARAPALIRIHDISPMNNFSSVRIEGVLERDARILTSGSVYYLINDGTGLLAAFDRYAGTEPQLRAGCRIAATGSLSIGAGNDRRLNVEKVKVVDAHRGSLSEVGQAIEGQQVSVEGAVCRSWAPRNGSKAPFKIILKDAGGELDVVHWLDGVPKVTVGDHVCATGVVELYQGRIQVKVLRGDDLRIVMTAE